MRVIIQEINQRVAGIKLEKDNWQLYSEVQGEIDTMVQEAINDIQKIKLNLKKRFEAVQAGKKQQTRNNKRSSSRPPRNQERKNGGDNVEFAGERPRKS